MKVRWNTTFDMIMSLIDNEKALNLLSNNDVEWPLLSDDEWIQLKELCPFLEQFKELTLYFSKTTECRMSDLCLDFEDLLVDIKVKYLDKKEEMTDKLWFAANAAYTKLTKYYTKINSASFAIATILDPRYKLEVYDSTQDPDALKASAILSIERAFKVYSEDTSGVQTNEGPVSKKQKRFATLAPVKNELNKYLQEDRVGAEDSPLDYWRANKIRFPILARMARDYLALQPTSKDVEGNFSKGRRTIAYYRRSQNASTVRNQMLVNSGYNLGVFA
jgi:hypothetical protein